MDFKDVLIWIIIILVIIFLIVGIVFIGIKLSKKTVEKINYSKIRIKAIDKYTCSNIEDLTSCKEIKSEFIIIGDEGGKLSNNLSTYNGNTKEGVWTEVNIINSSAKYKIYGKKDGYDLFEVDIPSIDSGNKGEIYLKMEKIGKLIMWHNHTLQSGRNIFNLNIKADGTYKKSAICFTWSPNIIYATLKDKIDVCNSGWLNYTHDYGNGSYEWVKPLGSYICKESNKQHLCKEISNARCIVDDEPIPRRLYRQVDHCFDIDKTFENKEEYIISIEYKTEDFIKDDFIEIRFLDKIKVFDGGKFVYSFESLDGIDDIGGKDMVEIIK